jgi:hypothetical protein
LTLLKSTANARRVCTRWPVGWNFQCSRLEIVSHSYAQSASHSTKQRNFYKLGNCVAADRFFARPSIGERRPLPGTTSNPSKRERE